MTPGILIGAWFALECVAAVLLVRAARKAQDAREDRMLAAVQAQHIEDGIKDDVGDTPPWSLAS